MKIVVIGAGPERKEMVQTPGEVITRMRVDGLEETEHDPHVHGQNVKVFRDSTPEDRRADSTETENHDFDRRSILRGQTKGSRVLVVNLVDVFVQRTPMQSAMGPVMPGIFHDEENRDLVGHFQKGRERNGGGQTAELGHRVEQPDLGEFDGEVTEEHEHGAVPLFLRGRHFMVLDFVLVQRRDAIDHDPR